MAEACKVAALIEFISRKWILHVLHAIHNGADTFSTIQKGANGVNSRMLTTRLLEMQEYGLIDRKIVCEKPMKIRYSLTKKGEELAAEMDRMDEIAMRW